jgi:excisionase family DNA binding protein
MESTRKYCRTFPDHQAESLPGSVTAILNARRSLLTPSELANLLAISNKTLYAWVAAGKIPAVQLGSSIRFCGPTTAKWLQQRSA